MKEYSPKRRTALVLTGSGTSGAYHAGVLKALDESGVKIDLVVGSGVGAVAAAFAAVAGGPGSTAPAGSGTASGWRLLLSPPPGPPARCLACSRRILGVFLLPAGPRPRSSACSRRSLLIVWLVWSRVSAVRAGLASGLGAGCAPTAVPRRPRAARSSSSALVVVAFRRASRPDRDRRRMGEAFEAVLDAAPRRRAPLAARSGRSRAGPRVAHGAALGGRARRSATSALARREPRPARLPRADPAHGRPRDRRRAALRSPAGRASRLLRRGPLPRRALAARRPPRRRGPARAGLRRAAVRRGGDRAPAAPGGAGAPRGFPAGGLHAGEDHRLTDASARGGVRPLRGARRGRRAGDRGLGRPAEAPPLLRAAADPAALADARPRHPRAAGGRPRPGGRRARSTAWSRPSAIAPRTAAAPGRTRPPGGSIATSPSTWCVPRDAPWVRSSWTARRTRRPRSSTTPADLLEQGYRDAYRLFVEPVVGAAPEPRRPRPQAEEPASPIEL